MANYLFSGIKSSWPVGSLSLGLLHHEVILSEGQFDGYRVVCIVHYKEKTAIGHEFDALHLCKNNDPSLVIVLRIERRPTTRKVASSSDVETDDSISPMERDCDYSQFYHISTTYCNSQKPLTVLAVCEVCTFIRKAAPAYSLFKAKHCFWFCAAFLIRLRMLDYCTGLAERGPEYKRRGHFKGVKMINENSIEELLIACAANRPSAGIVPMPPSLSTVIDNDRTPIPLQDTLVAYQTKTGYSGSTPASSQLSNCSILTPSLSAMIPARSPSAAIVASPASAKMFRTASQPATITIQAPSQSRTRVSKSAPYARGSLPSAYTTGGNRLQRVYQEWTPSDDCLGHQGIIYSVCFSLDKQHIISGSEDHTVRIWDATSGSQVRPPLKGHTGRVKSVAVSPDGRRIASVSDDQTVRIWDLETGVPVTEPLRGHTNSVRSVAFSPDGRKIVSGSSDESVRIWDVETGAAVGEPLRGHSWRVLSVVWSPDGSRIVSGSGDCTIRVWDARTGTPVGEPLCGHTLCVNSVAFSPDGSRVVSGSFDVTVRLWDIASQRALGEPLRGHTDWVRSVAFSPDGRWIASGSDDETVRIWDGASGGAAGEVAQLDAGSEVWSVAWSPAGDWVAAGCQDGKIRIWRKVAS